METPLRMNLGHWAVVNSGFSQDASELVVLRPFQEVIGSVGIGQLPQEFGQQNTPEVGEMHVKCYTMTITSPINPHGVAVSVKSPLEQLQIAQSWLGTIPSLSC